MTKIWYTECLHVIRPSELAEDFICQDKVPTAFGNARVSVYGDRSNHPIVTFHDLGLDSETTFQNFFLFASGGLFTKKFCIYNINAPGQEIDNEPLPENYVYPTMDGLAQIIQSCVEHYRLKSFIGMGVGVGANVMMRYALKKIENVDALILINCVGTMAGWIEWGYQKMNLRYLRSSGMTAFTADYLLWHHFGKVDECSSAVVRQYRAYFLRLSNPANLAAFIEAYINRTALSFSRDGSNGPALRLPVLQIVGSSSAFIGDSVEVNSRLDPTNSEWIKISQSSGLVLDDRSQSVTHAMILFLQGLGYFPSLNVAKAIKEISNVREHRENSGGLFTNLEENIDDSAL